MVNVIVQSLEREFQVQCGEVVVQRFEKEKTCRLVLRIVDGRGTWKTYLGTTVIIETDDSLADLIQSDRFQKGGDDDFFFITLSSDVINDVWGVKNVFWATRQEVEAGGLQSYSEVRGTRYIG